MVKELSVQHNRKQMRIDVNILSFSMTTVKLVMKKDQRDAYNRLHQKISRGLNREKNLDIDDERLSFRLHSELCHAVYHSQLITLLRSKNKIVQDLAR